MSTKQPNSRRNLDIAITRLCNDMGLSFIQTRFLIANTIIGQLVPDGVIKGGSALKLRYGDSATRFSRDFDTARKNELEIFFLDMQSALTAGWNGFAGSIIRREPAKPKGVPGEYIMQPFDIKLSYNSSPWLTVLLEVGHDEIGDTNNPDMYIAEDVVELFEKLNLPEPKAVPLLAIQHQIAQKFHALTGEGSERAHDLIDLQIIVNKEIVDYKQTKNSCTRLFASRKMQTWPPTVTKGANWDQLYSAQVEDLDVLQTVDEAITWANNLIHIIENSD